MTNVWPSADTSKHGSPQRRESVLEQRLRTADRRALVRFHLRLGSFETARVARLIAGFYNRRAGSG